MMCVKSSVKYSPIHGLGCFADEKIKKGQVVWELNPKIDLEFSETELAAFSEITKDFLRTYSYGQQNASGKCYVLCGDHARHMNHADDPNLLEVNGKNVAARDIEAGEELTCDYTIFDLDYRQKLRP